MQADQSIEIDLQFPDHRIRSRFLRSQTVTQVSEEIIRLRNFTSPILVRLFFAGRLLATGNETLEHVFSAVPPDTNTPPVVQVRFALPSGTTGFHSPQQQAAAAISHPPVRPVVAQPAPGLPPHLPQPQPQPQQQQQQQQPVQPQRRHNFTLLFKLAFLAVILAQGGSALRFLLFMALACLVYCYQVGMLRFRFTVARIAPAPVPMVQAGAQAPPQPAAVAAQPQPPAQPQAQQQVPPAILPHNPMAHGQPRVILIRRLSFWEELEVAIMTFLFSLNPAWTPAAQAIPLPPPAAPQPGAGAPVAMAAM